MDFREEILAVWRQAYLDHPGLEQFKTRKKMLLWGVMGLFVLQKAVGLVSLWGFGNPLVLLFGAVVGLALPGIFALAVWRGSWKFSLALLLPAIYLAVDVLWNGLPVLASGEPYYTSFYVILAVEGLMALYLAGVTIWLSVPKRNRELGQVMNQVNEHLIRRSKELAAQNAGRGNRP